MWNAGAQSFPDACVGWIDVRDVACAHIHAFEIPSANGRYCLVERFANGSQLLEVLQELYPTLEFPAKWVYFSLLNYVLCRLFDPFLVSALHLKTCDLLNNIMEKKRIYWTAHASSSLKLAINLDSDLKITLHQTWKIYDLYILLQRIIFSFLSTLLFTIDFKNCFVIRQIHRL